MIEVEINKFTGPTVKLLRLASGSWAILDHEYNLRDIIGDEFLPRQITELQHPPQRERPRPILPSDELPLSQVNLIEVGDLDL